jgi:hypothetical protein
MSFVSFFLSPLASMLFGALYFGALKRPWLAQLENGALAQTRSAQPLSYVLAFTAQLGVSLHIEWLFSLVDSHFGFGPGGLIPLLCFNWICLIVLPLAMNYRFQGRPMALLLLDSGFWFGAIAVQTAMKLAFYL